jgi:hypothetical protein
MANEYFAVDIAVFVNGLLDEDLLDSAGVNPLRGPLAAYVDDAFRMYENLVQLTPEQKNSYEYRTRENCDSRQPGFSQ